MSPQLAGMLGLELPTYAIRHEICSSEPLKPCLDPMVSELSTGLYFSQSMRGEIVGGVSIPEQPSTRQNSTLRFLTRYSERISALMPRFSHLKILRQWAGLYDVSPDGNPLLGALPQAPEFYLCNGFVGHGFMMAPIVGKLYAEWLSGGNKHEIFDRYAAERFRDGREIIKEDFNIG